MNPSLCSFEMELKERGDNAICTKVVVVTIGFCVNKDFQINTIGFLFIINLTY